MVFPLYQAIISMVGILFWLLGLGFFQFTTNIMIPGWLCKYVQWNLAVFKFSIIRGVSWKLCSVRRLHYLDYTSLVPRPSITANAVEGLVKTST